MNDEKKIEHLMEAVCESCHWPYVYRDDETMHAEKCAFCPVVEAIRKALEA